MILAAVADLMFSSRIRAAAAGGAADVRFARTAREALEQARTLRPSLVLIDLNGGPLDPLDTIASLKAEPTLAGTRIVGFVSHVQGNLIAAARAAGIDEVMARSAFVAKLPELLGAGRKAGEKAAPAPERTSPPTLADVNEARQRIASRVRRTPLVGSDWLSGLSAPGSGEVLLKVESLQATGSFKSRGALNAILALAERLPPGNPAPTIVTASAGNHGRALAWAAAHANVKVIVFTPRDAPAVKLDAIGRHGAELRAEAASYEDSERMAKAFAVDTGALFISAYSHPDLLAAVGSIALEILEERPDVGRIVVPVGGGGLIAGIAAAAKAVKPETEIVGVEVEASHPFSASLAAGRIVEVEVGPTLADGLAGNMDPDNLAFPIVQSLVDRVLIAGEEWLREAIRGLVHHEHLVVEGAGAVGVAAILGGVLPGRPEPTAVVISGGNIDTARLAEVLSERAPTT